MTGADPAVRADGSPLRALVVDDEAPLARLVAGYLTREGFEVTVVGDGLAAVKAARDESPDVIVLDLMLPGLDGVEACRQIRTFSDAYLIMLTARTEEVDKLVGLSVGADDYLTKPFSPRELVARIRVMLRRPRTGRLADPGASAPPIRRVGDLEILPLAREVRRSGDLVTLTPIEFDLLDALSGSPNVAFSRRQLIEHVWGANYFGDEHLVDVHIGNLRRKLGDDAGAPRYVRTVRSIGYRIGSGQPEQ